jgi:site-specific DNA-methyltransferase (adenine-specific)
MKQVQMTEEQYEDYLNYLTDAPNIQDVKKPKKGEFGEYNTHPTIKPVKLMEWLVKLMTNPGDTVLDPFNGSGTTGVAAVGQGRNYIGIEMSAEYCEIAKKRIGEVAGD